jgi:tetratricopeptide (TPR) repeat protein
LLARTYARTGDMALAADSYRRLLAVNPRQGTAAASLAPLLADQGDLNGAVQVLEEYLKAQPEDLIVLAELAGFQLRQGNDTAAEATARRIMAVKGQPGLGEFELGRVFQARKQYAEAAEAFRASRKLRPNDPLPLEGPFSRTGQTSPRPSPSWRASSHGKATRRRHEPSMRSSSPLNPASVCTTGIWPGSSQRPKRAS